MNEVADLRKTSSRLQEERLVQTSKEEEIESENDNLARMSDLHLFATIFILFRM